MIRLLQVVVVVVVKPIYMPIYSQGSGMPSIGTVSAEILLHNQERVHFSHVLAALIERSMTQCDLQGQSECDGICIAANSAHFSVMQ